MSQEATAVPRGRGAGLGPAGGSGGWGEGATGADISTRLNELILKRVQEETRNESGRERPRRARQSRAGSDRIALLIRLNVKTPDALVRSSRLDPRFRNMPFTEDTSDTRTQMDGYEGRGEDSLQRLTDRKFPNRPRGSRHY